MHDSAISRRGFLAGSAAAMGALVLPTTAAAATRPADITGFDPVQRFVRLVPGANGIIYAIQADGQLFWYRHADWRGGTNTWSDGGGLRIGTGWRQFTTVLGGADGQLLAVHGNGDVLWYRYVLSDPNSGAGSWAPNSGNVIGSGFRTYGRVFGGFDNVVYGVDDGGGLWWYRHLAGDGTTGSGAWANGGAGAVIGQGFKYFPYLCADPNGVIFGVTNADTPAGTTIIATGRNPAGGAQMTYYENAAGGWVFSASSLSFNGSLPFDQFTPTILRNVFHSATA